MLNLKKIIIYIAFIFPVFFISPLNAQSVQPAGDGHFVYAGPGLDGSVVIEGGYVTPKLFQIAPLDLSLAIPTGKIWDTPGSYRFAASAHWAYFFSGNWGTNLRPGTKIYTLRSPTWSGFAWHFDFQSQTGYIAPKWSVTLDLGIAPKFTTYVNPSDQAEENYSGIKAGFYAKGLEAMFNYGLSGYWRFTDHFGAGLRLWMNVPLEESKNPLARAVTDGVISFHIMYFFNTMGPAGNK